MGVVGGSVSGAQRSDATPYATHAILQRSKRTRKKSDKLLFLPYKFEYLQ